MSLLNDTIIILINVLHLLVIFFVLLTPFSGSNYLLLLHIIVVPFIIFHWLLNNNLCCLTIMEAYIKEKTTGVKTSLDECFVYQIVAPIYDFNKNHEMFSDFIYGLTWSMWGISVFMLGRKFSNGEINSWNDFAQI